MPSIPPQAHIVANAEHLVAELEGDLVIMSVQSGSYYGLDAVGRCVWRLIQQPRTFSEIVAGVVDVFEVDTATAERDIRAFLDEMRSEGLVVVTAEKHAA